MSSRGQRTPFGRLGAAALTVTTVAGLSAAVLFGAIELVDAGVRATVAVVLLFSAGTVVDAVTGKLLRSAEGAERTDEGGREGTEARGDA